MAASPWTRPAITSFAGSIGGAGGLTKTGAGLLSLTGASSYTGATTVDAGTLQLGTGGSLAPTTALIVNGGSFDIENGSGQTVGSLAGTGGAVTLGNRQPHREPDRDHELCRQHRRRGRADQDRRRAAEPHRRQQLYRRHRRSTPARCSSAAAAAWRRPRALIVNGGVFDIENGSGQTVGSLAGTAAASIWATAASP